MIDTEAITAELLKIDWAKHLKYGNIKVQIRDGKLAVVFVEETFKIEKSSVV